MRGATRLMAIALLLTSGCTDDATNGDGQPGAGNTEYRPSEQLQQRLALVEKARRGEPVDRDGDGSADFVRTEDADGMVTVEAKSSSGYTTFFYERNPDGSGTVVSDANGDGDAEVEISFTAEPAARVFSRDTDFDGVLDRHTTETFDLAAGNVTIVVETDPDRDGAFDEVLRSTEPIARFAGSGGCNGMAGFPSEEGGQTRVGGIAIDVSGSANDVNGRCSNDHAKRLAKSFECALDRAQICLQGTNGRLANEFFTAMTEGMDIEVACGNTCMNNLATTETVCFLGICFDDPKINFNTESFARSDDELCSIALHELMHTVGEGYEAGHDEGSDEVYSCSRYCGGCVDVANGAPHSSNVDCNRCADTVDRKMECGYKQNLVEGECGELGDGLCHSVLGCPLGPCESCMTLKTELCDTTPLGVSSFVCCAACPSDCNQSMDMPCGAPPQPENTCSQPPPFCR